MEYDFVFVGPDFGRHASVPQHLAEALPSSHKVIWLETIGIRSPRLNWSDLKRSVEKLATWVFAKRRSMEVDLPSNFSRINPVMMPFNQWSFVRRFNLKQVQRALKKELRARDLRPFILVSTGPNDVDLIGAVGEACSVYYIIDDFRFWHGMRQDLLEKMEHELLDKVDVVVVSSDRLRELKVSSKAQTHLLTHGVDVEHFSRMAPPKPLPVLDREFHVCYFGLFDERSDQELLAMIAERLPRTMVTIVGSVVTSIERLKGIPNIRFLGPVAYEDLPREASFADAFILPYHLNELSMSINPIKIKEYLATSRPVVATALPEVRKFASYLHIANDADEFVRALDDIRCGSSSALIRSTAEDGVLLQQSWKDKASEFVKICKVTLEHVGARLT